MDRSRRAPAVGSRRVLAPCVLRNLNERQSAECAPVAAVLLRERCKDQSAGSARPEAARSTQHWEIPTRLWKELQVPCSGRGLRRTIALASALHGSPAACNSASASTGLRGSCAGSRVTISGAKVARRERSLQVAAKAREAGARGRPGEESPRAVFRDGQLRRG